MNPYRNPPSPDYPRNRAEVRKNRRVLCTRFQRVQRVKLYKGLQK